MLLRFSDEEHLAIGDWLDKDQSKAAMPHHYSASKCQQSVRLKHRAYEVASKISEYESWEMVPYDVLQEADQQALAKLNKLIQQDPTVL